MVPVDELTTLTIRGLQSSVLRGDVALLLDREGFAGMYDFLYVPIAFDTNQSLGYALADFVTHEQALRAWRHIGSLPGLDVEWSALQGYEAHVERYRNSPTMHFSVAEEYRPAVYARGSPAPFPEPTKRLRAPRLRRAKEPQP